MKKNMMNKITVRMAMVVIIVTMIATAGYGQVRIKDIATIRGYSEVQLVGYSLVVGLDGTGDGRRALFTNQSVRNMLQRFGISIHDERMSTRNVASVMVTAVQSPFSKQGSTIDVVVSSMGDATSLEGGTLLMTPMQSKEGIVYAHAQGSMSVGGVNVETVGGERYRKNFALVGRVPGGGVVDRELATDTGDGNTLDILLREPDFTTVSRIAQAVDDAFGNAISTPLDAGTISVDVPQEFQDPRQRVRMIAQLETVEVVPDQKARVVINERTGTVVVEGNVKLSPAAVCQGGLTVRVSAVPVISQPQPFSQGQTVMATQTMTTVSEGEQGAVVVLEEPASVTDLANGLNALKVSARDLISIFQALKQAGSLKAELLIM